jgi:hypothetical protein
LRLIAFFFFLFLGISGGSLEVPSTELKALLRLYFANAITGKAALGNELTKDSIKKGVNAANSRI